MPRPRDICLRHMAYGFIDERDGYHVLLLMRIEVAGFDGAIEMPAHDPALIQAAREVIEMAAGLLAEREIRSGVWAEAAE